MYFNTFTKIIYKLPIGINLQNNSIKQDLSIGLSSCRYNVQSIHKRNSSSPKAVGGRMGQAKAELKGGSFFGKGQVTGEYA